MLSNKSRAIIFFIQHATIYQDSISRFLLVSVILVEEIVSHCQFSEIFTKIPLPTMLETAQGFYYDSYGCHKTDANSAGPILNSSNRGETVSSIETLL